MEKLIVQDILLFLLPGKRMPRVSRIDYFLLRLSLFKRGMLGFYAMRRADLVAALNFFYLYRHKFSLRPVFGPEQGPARGASALLARLFENGDHLVGAGVERQGMEVGFDVESFLQQPMEFFAIQLRGAELAQVIRHELRVEQLEASARQPGCEVDQGDLRSVALIGEHAFAEVGAVESDAIETAHEAIAVPNLDRVAVAEVEQVAVERADAVVDPRRAATGPRGRGCGPQGGYSGRHR